MKRFWQRARGARWPSATTVIALIALVLSAVQLAFSVPLLTRYYIHPELVVTRESQKPEAKIAVPTYVVSNNGNTLATKIEVGFIVQDGQKLTLMPAIAANIVEQEAAAVIKSVRVEVERLSPGEQFTVRIFAGPSHRELRKDVAGLFAGIGILFPRFSFVRSAEGPGRYVPAEGETGLWMNSGKWDGRGLR